MTQRGLATMVFVLMAALATAAAQSSSPLLPAAGSVDLCKGGWGGAAMGSATGAATAAAVGNGGNGNGASSGDSGGSDGLSPQEGARAFALRAVYFRREAYASTADCLTAAYTHRLPLDLCR